MVLLAAERRSDREVANGDSMASIGRLLKASKSSDRGQIREICGKRPVRRRFKRDFGRIPGSNGHEVCSLDLASFLLCVISTKVNSILSCVWSAPTVCGISFCG